MWYKIDFTKLSLQLLPPVLRSKFLTALLGVMTVPLRYVYGRFSTLKTSVDDRLNITGNVQYLEKALNAAFYLREGQIYIETPEERERRCFMYFKGEGQQVQKMWPLSTGIPYYFVQKDESAVPVNFIVKVPTFLCTSADKSEDKYGGRNYKTIKNILSIYKPAGRTFSIELYDYE